MSDAALYVTSVKQLLFVEFTEQSAANLNGQLAVYEIYVRQNA